MRPFDRVTTCQDGLYWVELLQMHPLRRATSRIHRALSSKWRRDLLWPTQFNQDYVAASRNMNPLIRRTGQYAMRLQI